MNLPSKFSRRVRRVFYVLHLWTGLILGLWFAYIGLTGSVLAWLPDLLPGEFQSHFPYDTSAGTAIVPPSRIIAALAKAYPQGKPEELNTFSYPTRMFPYYLTIMPGPKEPGDQHFILVDPYSAKVHPPSLVPDFVLGVIAHTHSGAILGLKGMLISGVFSAFSLIMLLSGLWLWWPSTLKQLKHHLTFRRGVPLRRMLYDLHNVMGIYLYIILFVTTLTAVLTVANSMTSNGVEHAVNGIAGGAAETEPKMVPSGERLPVDTLFSIARKAVGEMTLSQMQFPTHPDAPFKAEYQGSRDGLLTGGDLVIDPYTGKVLSISPDRSGSAGHRLIHLANDLHLGTFGGVWTKILYTITGLMPLGLLITGVWRWWNGKRAKRPKAAPSPIA
jgi:uncharacterized iron-regulated membrane protein